MRFPSIESRTGTHLPRQHWPAHELCFFVHDALVQMLQAGERAGAFSVNFKLCENEITAFSETDNLFQWLERHRAPEVRTAVLVATVFPAILTDMLHCVYESLESSRKAKLIISYMLLRKPIQESLYVLEAVIADRSSFAQKLTENPTRLWSQGAGGRDGHKTNIRRVLEVVGDNGSFSADYLAQLRYDKSAIDGFDGVCNQAMHLFTSHKAIETSSMNINFIFSDGGSRETQWSFLYTRLPYILTYAYRIAESICAGISPTQPEYLEELERRLAAHIILWGATLDETYASPALLKFVSKHREWLFEHCGANGHRAPTFKDLMRMRTTGAFPGESGRDVRQRMRHFQKTAEISGSAAPSRRQRLLRALGLGTVLRNPS